MHSCIYEGFVAHRRHVPVSHSFRYPLYMLWLDLDELPQLVRRGGMIQDSRHAVTSFLVEDHLSGDTRPLRRQLAELIEHSTGKRPSGPIRLLTQLRNFGYYFSPLNLFYLYGETGKRVEYVVAEVNNTPWGERHCYVLSSQNRRGPAGCLNYSHAKQFHVSPFMGMEMHYHWALAAPGSELAVQLTNVCDSAPLFDARLVLTKRELSRSQLRRMAIKHPLIGLRIVAAIYFQAFQLWWKRCPSYTHPEKAPRLTESARAEQIVAQLPAPTDHSLAEVHSAESYCSD